MSCFIEIKRIGYFRSFCAATNKRIRIEFGLQSSDDENSTNDGNNDDGDADGDADGHVDVDGEGIEHDLNHSEV